MGDDRARAQARFLPLFALAWAGALLITLGVLGLNVLARTLLRSRI
jgi:ABC-type phosphate transport system permease subunit